MKCWKILLCAAVFASADKVFEEVENNSHFSKIGEVSVITERADIVIDIDLDEVGDLINKSCELVSTLFHGHNISLAAQVQGRFNLLCHEDRVTWDGLADRVNGLGEVERGRRPRFIVTALLSALAGGVAATLWGHHVDAEKLKTLAAEQGRLMTVIDGMDARSKIDEVHIRDLGLILSRDHELRSLRRQAVDGALTLLGTFELVHREVARFSAALSSALQLGTAAPVLFLPGALSKQLHRLQRAAASDGMRLDISHEHEVWRLPLSFGTFSSRILRLVIHIPVRETGNTYNVLRLTEAPWKFSGSDEYGVAQDPRGRSQLAVSIDGARFFELRAEDGLLPPQGSWRIWRPVAVHTDDETSCLWGLYKGRAEQVKRTCNLLTPPGGLSFHQVSANEFVVHSGKVAEKVDVWCGEIRTASALFAGSRLLRLGEGCRATGKQVTMRNSRHDLQGHAHIRAAPLDLRLEELSRWTGTTEDGKQEFLAWVRQPERKLLHVAQEHRRVMRKLAEETEDGVQRWIRQNPGWAAAIALTLLLVIFCGAMRAKLPCARWRRRRARYGGHDDDYDTSGPRSGEERSGSARRKSRMRSSTSSPTRTPNRTTGAEEGSGEGALPDGLSPQELRILAKELRKLRKNQRTSSPRRDDLNATVHLA